MASYMKDCPDCRGTGRVGTAYVCGTCSGIGGVPITPSESRMQQDGKTYLLQDVDCSECKKVWKVFKEMRTSYENALELLTTNLTKLQSKLHEAQKEIVRLQKVLKRHQEGVK